ncbi:MAG TPA: aldose 1-epimerase family protein [Mycobacteriales bacterium]|nr:aldose 1-epimerase family protein [Mycobacteriales bacterium]
MHGAHRAVVVEVGGGLREYTVDGAPVVDGYAAAEMCSGGRGQTLTPWPNRLADGRYSFGGESFQLPLTEPEKSNAIHGLTRWASWTLASSSASSAVLTHALHPQPGYPFALDCRLEYALSDTGLTVHTVTTNVSDRPCPYGTGAHPYLTAGTDKVDGATLQAPGRRYLPVDEQGIPTGTVDAEGTPYDYRTPRSLDGALLDHCYTDLERDPSGTASVTLRGPERAVRLWFGPEYPYLQVFTGDTLPPERRRGGLAVEPMTCPPDAFRTGDGLLTLAPGETVSTTWGVAPVV